MIRVGISVVGDVGKIIIRNLSVMREVFINTCIGCGLNKN